MRWHSVHTARSSGLSEVEKSRVLRSKRLSSPKFFQRSYATTLYKTVIGLLISCTVTGCGDTSKLELIEIPPNSYPITGAVPRAAGTISRQYVLSYQVPPHWPATDSSTFYMDGLRIGISAAMRAEIPAEKSPLSKYEQIARKKQDSSVIEYRLVTSDHFNGYWTKEVSETAKNEGFKIAWKTEAEISALKYTHFFIMEGRGLDVAIGITCIDFEVHESKLLKDIALILETIKVTDKGESR
jgi:hypothetical protein